jgi:hypothetical protein
MMAGSGQSFEEIRRRETGANTPDMERSVKWFVELNCSSSLLAHGTEYRPAGAEVVAA